MIKPIFSFLLILINITSEEVELSDEKYIYPMFNYLNVKNKKLGIKNLNTNLLNLTIFKLVNQKRKKKGLDTLTYDDALNAVSLEFQDKLELKRFANSSSIERKINRTSYQKTKKLGFNGGLIIPVVGESEALDYDGKSEFFLNKENKNSEFKLFYGKKPKKNEINPSRKEIKALDYFSFAKKMLKEIDSENKRHLYSKAFKWGGVHLQWDYKTLSKRQIPQIKMIFILGGYATAGMR